MASGWKQHALIVCVCPRNIWTILPVLLSHSLSVASSDALKIERPSGLKVQAVTGPEWPLKTRRQAPVRTSHSRSVLSTDALTTNFPSGLNAQLLTVSP